MGWPDVKSAPPFRFGLRTRFIVIAGLLVLATIASGLWSALSFARLSSLMGETLIDSEATTSAASDFTTALEREDDALLLHLTDSERGGLALAQSRDSVNAKLAQFAKLLTTAEERSTADALGRDVTSYRAATDALLATASGPTGFGRYHREVNPLLRQAVARAGVVRDQHFSATQRVAVWARDEAHRSVLIVSGVSVAAFMFSIAVVLYLARIIIWPLRELSTNVDAMRQGDFERRSRVRRHDELGRLADGINRMSEDLLEFRRTNIREVLRAKRTLEATLAALPDAVVVAGPDGAISSANEAAVRLLRGKCCAQPPSADGIELPPAGQAMVQNALAGGLVDPPQFSPRLTLSLDVDGHTREFLPRVVPIRSSNAEEQGVVLVLNDVTEFIRLDERRLELVAVASHEFKTPLTTLRMALLMLKEASGGLGSREQALVATALFGVDQLGQTVDEFLDLTRIEAGQLRLSYERISFGDLVTRVAHTFRPRCDEAGIALEVAECGVFAPVRGDAARLAAVLGNLLDNAVKYTPSGGTVRVRAALLEASTQSSPSRVEVSVSDSGPGVPAEFRERIFEKFFRVEHLRPQRERGARGSGIGLYLARQIVEAHGGEIACGSGDGARGANIGFVIPLEPPKEMLSE
jgi:two-component system, NtrC family, sensor histidine kinase KinB